MSGTEIGIWTVQYTLPVAPDRRYASQRECTVASDTLPNALAVLLTKYPEATIHTANKRGRGELLVDARVGLVDGAKYDNGPL